MTGPPDVRAWRGVQVLEPLTGGVRNPVYLARRRDERFVIRVSGRGAESLAWELDLLDALSAAGVMVPHTIPTDDGQRHDRGVLVQRFIDGDRPTTPADWDRVVATISAVHEATVGWPQRPGFRSARELMRDASGGDVDLAAMPPDAVALVRGSWAAVLDEADCAIHGDMGQGNVLMTDDYVALIDWDEARVDVPAFDYAHLPAEVVPGGYDAVHRAGVAWEAATCWLPEPDYARRRLDELRRLVRS
jgi:Ser/Thr protein kinase RdoA (MazF antagonist)